MSYDILLVGCGIGSGIIASLLKDKYKILALDVRDHIGGNCFDYMSNGIYVHRYGPHIFHTKNPVVKNLIEQYTKLSPYIHRVTAEVRDGNQLLHLPFPYSVETEGILGRKLLDEEIVNLFFRDYSCKMWGCEWEQLPEAIRNRVPKRLGVSEYFPGECYLPDGGYTVMMEQMFKGVDILLGVDKNLWKEISAKQIVYCGRLDHVLGGRLKYRNLKIEHRMESGGAGITNYCHRNTSYTRRVNYNALQGKSGLISDCVSYETPIVAQRSDIAPFYTSSEVEDIRRAKVLMGKIKEKYNNIHFLGRLGTYQYLNMDQVVEQALELAKVLRV